jgi:hypothetical protein
MAGAVRAQATRMRAARMMVCLCRGEKKRAEKEKMKKVGSWSFAVLSSLPSSFARLSSWWFHWGGASQYSYISPNPSD